MLYAMNCKMYRYLESIFYNMTIICNSSKYIYRTDIYHVSNLVKYFCIFFNEIQIVRGMN